MNISQQQVDPIERLVELGLKVVLFFFILLGTAVLTVFFIYCVVNDKGPQARAISGFGDTVFFAAFAKLVWNYFVRQGKSSQVGVVPVLAAGASSAATSPEKRD